MQERGIALAQTVHSRDKGNPIFSYQSDVYTAGAIAAELLWNILGDGGKVSIFTTQKDLPFYARRDPRLSRCDAAGIRWIFWSFTKIMTTGKSPITRADALLRNYPDVRGIFVGSAKFQNGVPAHCRKPAPGGNFSSSPAICIRNWCPILSAAWCAPPSFRRSIRRRSRRFVALANYLITHIPAEQPVRMVRPQIVLHSNVEQFLTPMSDKRVAGVPGGP